MPAPSDDLMTDDEFERLLDAMHNNGGTPTPPDEGEALAIEALEVDDVEACRPRLLEALEAGGPIRIDLGRLTRIDTAGLQLLLACRRAAEAAGRAFDCLAPPPFAVQAARLSGLVAAVGDGPAQTEKDGV